MKKFLFFAAIAAISLASCSNDETIASQATSESNTISFRPLVNGVTRAADITETTLQSSGFTVTAVNNGSNPETQYFYGVSFTWNDAAYTSATKYYWPETGSLDFYAYAPAGNSQVTYPTSPNYKTFTVTPSTTVSEQVDLVYANTNNKSKATSASGVALNFRHTESKIAIKVKNTSADLKFEVTGWKVGYLSASGTFTYSASNTDTKNSSQLTSGWGSLATASASTTYSNTFSSQTIAASTSTETTITGSTEMILIPQSQTAATAYANSGSPAANDNVNGSYIAVQMTIKSNANDATVVSNGWAIWPVAFTWAPGKKYTYIVDLAGGGYSETNADSDAELDPILSGTEIKFVSVTVDDWAAGGDIAVPSAP